MSQAGRTIFEDTYAPRAYQDNGKTVYEKIPKNRVVRINDHFEATMTAGSGMIGVTYEQDGASAVNYGSGFLFNSSDDLPTGSAVEMGVRHAGTVRVAAGAAIARGAHLYAKADGRVYPIPTADIKTYITAGRCVGVAKTDGGIGSYILMTFNGLTPRAEAIVAL